MSKQDQKRLLKFYEQLNDSDKKSLLDFAEFLTTRTTSDAPVQEVLQPTPITRPEQESVIQAIKRLSASYHMLDKSKMLNETSVLVAQHTMQGRDAGEVIDELEIIFERHYRRYTGADES